jgi:O-glycosyl hydrolase
VWQLTSSNAITRLPDIGVAASSFAATLPPQSITLFVVARRASTPVRPAQPTGVRIVR